MLYGSDDEEERDNESDEDESSEGEDVAEIFGGSRKDSQKSSFEKRQEKV